ncbi:MAG: DUF2214 family protein [Zoogloeaceae bacterium]|jgi:putative membrane protein|nr:DUF2214 family protein [Zoogloeaceae bacterium]
MTTLLAALHYLALALGFAALIVRGIRFRESLSNGETRKILFADNIWGIAAALWIVTGLLRVFGGFEKDSAFYLYSHWFWLKMTLFGLVFLLEIWPMATLIGWRIKHKTSVAADEYGQIRKFLAINWLQVLLLVLIIFSAAAVTRDGFA